MNKKPKKKIFWIILIVILLLLCCGLPSILGILNLRKQTEVLGFSEPPWLYMKEDLERFEFEMELMELLDIDLGENYLETVIEDLGEDFEIKQEEEEIKEEKIIEKKAEVKEYSNEFFPELSFEYSEWELEEKLRDSKLINNAKDLELTLKKNKYILQISLTTVGPMGLEPMCYKKDEIEYTRIQGDTVRAFDGISYSYGYMYDQNHEAESFEMSKEFYIGEDGYVACGDTNILKVTSTTFIDEEFFSEDYLSAIISVQLHEKGEENEKVIKEADQIVSHL